MESQTRNILGWIVEKLPRSEEAAEEVLAANVVQSRKIASALADWKAQPWRLPETMTGIPNRNYYFHRPFRTVPHAEQPMTATFKACSAKQTSIACTILERHTLDVINDSVYTTNLESDLTDTIDLTGKRRATDIEVDSSADIATNDKTKAFGNMKKYSAAVKDGIKNSLQQLVSSHSITMTTDTGLNVAPTKTSAFQIDSKQQQQTSSSFQELITSITESESLGRSTLSFVFSNDFR